MPYRRIPLSTRGTIRIHEAFGTQPFHISQALDAGISESQVRTAMQNGALVRMHRGVYALADSPSLDPLDNVIVRCEASLASLGSARAAIAGRAAADLRELPFVRPRRAGDSRRGIEILIHEEDAARLGRRPGGAILRPVREMPTDIELVCGLPVTSLLHTAIDVARMGTRSSRSHRAKALPLAEALVPLDAATARHGARDHHEAAAAIRAMRHRFYYGPGIRTVDRALPHIDPRSESPLESWARGHMVMYDVPSPLIQQVVTGADGVTYRVDFCWPRARVILEVDGLDKYGATPAEVRAAKRTELARQRALEAAGWIVIRWTWDDLADDPAQVLRPLMRILRNAA